MLFQLNMSYNRGILKCEDVFDDYVTYCLLGCRGTLQY